MIEKTAHGPQPQPATLWRVTVEAWLRRQGLIAIRQKENRNVSTAFPKIWSHNQLGRTTVAWIADRMNMGCAANLNTLLNHWRNNHN